MPTKRLDPLQQIVFSTFQDITPVRLRLFLFANCITVLLFSIVSVSTIQLHEHAATTVGRDAAPSVIAAHEITIGVEEMDTALANQLLYQPASRESAQMERTFETWRVNVSKSLVAAAKNITYGNKEQIPIDNIQIALGDYMMKVQHARDVHVLVSPQDSIKAYREALRTLQKILLPNADALYKANAEVLESTYAEEKSRSALACGGVLVVGIILILLLIFTQVYVANRFRRRLNLPLMIATLIALAFSNHLYSELRQSAVHLKIAKEDSYDSIVSLLSARAKLYDANAAESRFLLDKENTAQYEKEFSDDIAAIARFSEGHNFSESLIHVQRQLANGERLTLPGVSGLLSDVFNNIRFEGEAPSAIDALQALSEYHKVDDEMRQFEHSGAHDAALKTGLGYDPESSKYPFTKFDDAIGRALKINEMRFARGIRDAFSDLHSLKIMSQIVALLVAICVYLGLRDRLAEYME